MDVAVEQRMRCDQCGRLVTPDRLGYKGANRSCIDCAVAMPYRASTPTADDERHAGHEVPVAGCRLCRGTHG